jgi:hypothetical protein
MPIDWKVFTRADMETRRETADSMAMEALHREKAALGGHS